MSQPIHGPSSDKPREPHSWSSLRNFGALRPPRLSPVRRYAAALAVTGLVSVIAHEVVPRPSTAPFVLFYCAVAAAAWLGGRGPGLVATLLSGAFASYHFVEPLNSWHLPGPSLLATVLFLVSASTIAVLCGSLREALLGADEKTYLLLKSDQLMKRAQEIAHLAGC
jgi:K+-sensing histidine kinase KdpD